MQPASHTPQAFGTVCPEAGAYSPEVNSAVCQTTSRDRVRMRRARRTDPVSSHDAADRAAAFAATHVGRILKALDVLMTATALEIATHSGLTIVQVDRRRKEMEDAGMVYMLRQGGRIFTRDGFMVWARAV